MRVNVEGEPTLTGPLISSLNAAGVTLSDDHPQLTISVNPADAGPYISADVTDHAFARMVVSRIGEQAMVPGGGILLRLAGGNRNDRLVVLHTPDTADALRAIELGVYAAICQYQSYEQQRGQRATHTPLEQSTDAIIKAIEDQAGLTVQRSAAATSALVNDTFLHAPIADLKQRHEILMAALEKHSAIEGESHASTFKRIADVNEAIHGLADASGWIRHEVTFIESALQKASDADEARMQEWRTWRDRVRWWQFWRWFQ